MFRTVWFEHWALPASIAAASLIGIGILGSLPKADSPNPEPTPVVNAPPQPSITHEPTNVPAAPKPDPSPSATRPTPFADGTADPQGLRVAARVSGDSSYARTAFGNSWVDTDRNGCNQRDDVLLRDAVKGTARVQQQGACLNDVIAGEWIDPYTGRRIVLNDLKDTRQAQAIQIDHIVALKEAWVSGARGWPQSRRIAFANDLDELAAVDGPTNASKSDGDPAAWRPKKDYQCAYATRWIQTKLKWDLSADPSEVTALEQMLAYCTN